MSDGDVALTSAGDGDTIVDKHCIGAIPGCRAPMIVVPIVAAHGLKIPKTSSRAMTSPAGTADTMEVLEAIHPSRCAADHDGYSVVGRT